MKTDVEAALKGNQWPLSCYGPFRDKPSIPNFIEDKSYEEIRALCKQINDLNLCVQLNLSLIFVFLGYEAKNNGTIHAMDQQLKQQISDAKNKSQMLFNLSPEALSLIVNMYNKSEGGNVSALISNNPFAVNAVNTITPRSSIFGQQSMNSSESIFGSTSNQVNPFAKNASGFGMGMSQNQNVGSIFGGPTSASTSGNIFASANTNTVGGSSFGLSSSFVGSSGSAFGSAQQSIFGGGSSSNANTCATGPFSQMNSGSPFALSHLGQSASMQQQSSSIFGKPAANQVFGGAATFSSKPSGLFSQQPTTGNIFGQSAFAAAVSTQDSIFGGSTTQTQPTFGQSAMQSQDNFRGGFAALNSQPLNAFSNSLPMASTTSNHPHNSMFGAGPSVFGTSASTTFNMSTSNMLGGSAFNQPKQEQQSLPQSAQMNSIFGGIAQSQQPFGQQAPQPFAQSTNNQNIFMQQSVFGGSQFAQNSNNSQPSQTPSIFGGSAMMQQSQPTQQPYAFSSNTSAIDAYSRMENLQKSDVEAFQTDTFRMKCIPTLPPPIELCV